MFFRCLQMIDEYERFWYFHKNRVSSWNGSTPCYFMKSETSFFYIFISIEPFCAAIIDLFLIKFIILLRWINFSWEWALSMAMWPWILAFWVSMNDWWIRKGCIIFVWIVITYGSGVPRFSHNVGNLYFKFYIFFVLTMPYCAAIIGLLCIEFIAR